MNKDKWQPIETAPKDGTFVLLYCPSSLGSYMDVYSFTECGGWQCSNFEYSPYPDPTHWMPLPDAPE
jgi:hypothetical protein